MLHCLLADKNQLRTGGRILGRIQIHEVWTECVRGLTAMRYAKWLSGWRHYHKRNNDVLDARICPDFLEQKNVAILRAYKLFFPRPKCYLS